MQSNDKRHALKLIPNDPYSKQQARKKLRDKCLMRIQEERYLKRNASVMHARETWLNAMVEQEVMKMGHIWSEEVRCLFLTQDIGHIIREEYYHAINIYEQQCSVEVGHLSLDHLLAIEQEIANETTHS